MANSKNDDIFVNSEKEQKAIKWENDVLFILMPSVGLVAFVMGLIGFILAIGSDKDYKIGVSVFLIILAILGALGIAYGVVQFIKRRAKRFKKEKPEPDEIEQ